MILRILKGESMKTRLFAVRLFAPVLALALAALANAQEISTGNLTLTSTRIKSATAIIPVPDCPNKVAAFSPTTIYCPPSGPCTIEVSVNSELSDISPGVDSLRYFVTIDGSLAGVRPTTNIGVNSTAKTGQMETGAARWFKNDLTPGLHTVEVNFCVNDTSGDGFTSGFVGDRTLVVRAYAGR
jgi:hypothetical protein